MRRRDMDTVFDMPAPPRKRAAPAQRLEAVLASPAADALRAPAASPTGAAPTLREALEATPKTEPTPSELVLALLHSSEIAREAQTAEHAAQATAAGRYAMFRTPRGLLHLEELSDDEALRLASKGKLSLREVEHWWEWRRRRLTFPRATRYAMFALRMQRAGLRHVHVHTDGRVELS